LFFSAQHKGQSSAVLGLSGCGVFGFCCLGFQAHKDQLPEPDNGKQTEQNKEKALVCIHQAI